MTVSAIKDVAEVVVYERANDIGGQWADNTDEITKKLYGSRHSSFYAGMWTNSPKETNMEVPNFPFPDDVPSYVKADVVLKYIKDYVSHFDLHKFIKTYHNVSNVYYKEAENEF